MGRLLFSDKWTMQKGLGRQVGGQGDKRIQIQILRFLCHYSGQDLESKSKTVRAYNSFLCEEQGPYKLTAQVQKQAKALQSIDPDIAHQINKSYNKNVPNLCHTIWAPGGRSTHSRLIQQDLGRIQVLNAERPPPTFSSPHFHHLCCQ